MLPEPWIPHNARRFLDTLLTPDKVVFEWGSGESTKYFAERVKKVVSIEHDKNIPFINIDNVEYKQISPVTSVWIDPCNPIGFASHSMRNMSFEKYVCSFTKYAKTTDIILIDGRARNSCLNLAIEKANPGAWIILDNTERTYYTNNIPLFVKKWDKIVFFGTGPINTYKWECTFWQKS